MEVGGTIRLDTQSSRTLTGWPIKAEIVENISRPVSATMGLPRGSRILSMLGRCVLLLFDSAGASGCHLDIPEYSLSYFEGILSSMGGCFELKKNSLFRSYTNPFLFKDGSTVFTASKRDCSFQFLSKIM